MIGGRGHDHTKECLAGHPVPLNLRADIRKAGATLDQTEHPRVADCFAVPDGEACELGTRREGQNRDVRDVGFTDVDFG